MTTTTLDRPTLDQFLAGAVLAYPDASGKPLTAKWSRWGMAPHLVVRDATGNVRAAPLMARGVAAAFYDGVME